MPTSAFGYLHDGNNAFSSRVPLANHQTMSKIIFKIIITYIVPQNSRIVTPEPCILSPDEVVSIVFSQYDSFFQR